MAMPHTMSTPHFDEYARLLLQLHELISQGKSDSEQADAVRDMMDDPWKHLSQDEIALLRGLSADLHTIGVDRTEPPSGVPAGFFEELSALWEAEEVPDALRLLREHEKELPVDFVAGMRGVYWYKLYEYDVALAFHDEALRLSPHDPFREASRLSSQVYTKHWGQSLARAEEILDRESHPFLLVAASDVFGVAARSVDFEQGRSLMQKSLSAAEKAEGSLEHWPNNAVTGAVRANAQVHRAVCLQSLGRVKHAIQACEFADPPACAAHFAKLYDRLRSEQAPNTAPADFRPELNLMPQLQLTTLSAAWMPAGAS